MFRFLAVFALASVASAEIQYPCGTSDITNQCAAEYLSQVAGCEAPTAQSTGELSYPFLIEAPFFDATIDRYESTFSGIGDAVISSFYTDSEAGKTVMTVTFPEVTNSGREVIEYHDDTEIDTEVDTAFVISYSGIVVTAQWEGVDSITIGTARVYSEVESSTYDLEADWPELAAAIASDSEGVAAEAAALVRENREIFNREEVLYVGRAVARLWWNTSVCANLP